MAILKLHAGLDHTNLGENALATCAGHEKLRVALMAHDCTFEALPTARKQRLPDQNAEEPSTKRRRQEQFGSSVGLNSQEPSSRGTHESAIQQTAHQSPTRGDSTLQSYRSASSASSDDRLCSPHDSKYSPRPSALESYDGMSARVAGDVDALSDLSWNEQNECTLLHATYRRMLPSRKGVGEDKTMPVTFALVKNSFSDTSEPRIDESDIKQSFEKISEALTDQHKEHLGKLFFEYVYPYFPIISKTWFLAQGVDISSRIRSLPISLASALFATSLPFMLYDDHLSTTLIHSAPSRSSLYSVAWQAIQNELHAPTLSTLQACLLMLQRGPTNRNITATPFKASLLGWTVSLANCLGLNHDCSGWQSLPLWERRVRTRLWWGVVSADTWISLETSTPPLISAAESSVRPIGVAGTADEVLATPSESIHFYHLASLSILCQDIHATFFTVRAQASTAHDLSQSLELARGLRSRLANWKQSYAEDRPLQAQQVRESKPSGDAALTLTYIVANVLIFRALVRTIHFNAAHSDVTHQDAAKAIIAGALTCCRDAVEYLETVVSSGSAWNAFWPSWSQSNFAIVSSFLAQMLYLLKQRDSTCHSTELTSLVQRWRQAIRLGAGSGGWGQTLMSLALLKLNSSTSSNSKQQLT
ncbi:hypothetical protein LTR56_000227 [Elasticomyces elasticus]|nr:hypothetical protein LTR56_000227 [Elasticomyces elasticus]KAK3667213.1 hypothetical protein LTR22_002080 [Elasticomyces elasticus]KAK4932987.1 hypothetical protein LTR49_000946 [Elasticomyces elasticus]KAK5768607.1 hypothetical protein LTS12_001030 [Elasticomyces elasticus]